MGNVNGGTAGHLKLIGWTGDFGDPDNFLGTFFQESGEQTQFGFRKRRVTRLLDRAESEVNQARRARLYQQANRLIMSLVPGVPYVHTFPALGARRNVRNYLPSPVGTESFRDITIGGQ